MMNEKAKKILILETQYMENYGSPEQPQWKMKGGYCYKVLGAPNDVDVMDIALSVQPPIEYSNDYSREYVIDAHWEEEGWLSTFEKSQLEYDGKICYPEPEIEYSEGPY